MSKTKILIAGVGGVGGYFGGILANYFFKNDAVEIIFFARGAHLEKIKKDGLIVIQSNEELHVHPNLVSSNTHEIGIVDYIIVCCKTFDLENITSQLLPCINKNTVMLPLLNGVESAEKIKQIAPLAKVLNGCTYIVSYIKEAGVVENKGNIQRIFLGSMHQDQARATELLKLLKQADIDANLSETINEIVWEKFYMISANSTATSYFNASVGEILNDENKYHFLLNLLNEVHQLALAKGIIFKEDMIAKTVLKLKSLPYETTSSMQRDFMKINGKTELESITGYVVNESKKLHIDTPNFNIAYNKLMK
jgi:2-dehydropantoate 2-reductase